MNQKSWKSKFMSPSRIDSYVYHRDSEQSVDDFIDNLLHLREMPPIVDAGTQFHEFIEKCGYINIPNKFTHGNWIYEIPFDIEISLPIYREYRISTLWNDIEINGKIDAGNHLVIHDLKTTQRLDIEKYINSWQWRIYLWMTNIDKFVYNIFELKLLDKNALITDYQELKLYRYSNMESEIHNLYYEYNNYLDSIKHLIKEREIN